MPNPCPGGIGIRDGRGYGPYGRGYYVHRQGASHSEPLYAPFGPNCERFPPASAWDVQAQANLGLGESFPTVNEYTRQRKTYNVLMTGLLGASGLLLVWAMYPKRR